MSWVEKLRYGSDREHATETVPTPGIVRRGSPLRTKVRTQRVPWKALQSAALCLPAEHGNQSLWESGSPGSSFLIWNHPTLGKFPSDARGLARLRCSDEALGERRAACGLEKQGLGGLGTAPLGRAGSHGSLMGSSVLRHGVSERARASSIPRAPLPGGAVGTQRGSSHVWERRPLRWPGLYGDEGGLRRGRGI